MAKQPGLFSKTGRHLWSLLFYSSILTFLCLILKSELIQVQKADNPNGDMIIITPFWDSEKKISPPLNLFTIPYITRSLSTKSPKTLSQRSSVRVEPTIADWIYQAERWYGRILFVRHRKNLSRIWFISAVLFVKSTNSDGLASQN